MDINTNQEIQYVGSFKRSSAVSIDLIIVTFIRIVAAQVLGAIWLNDILQKFTVDFEEHFGTEIVKNTAEHREFIISHPAFLHSTLFLIILILIGLLYHTCLNSSAWQGTIGKRLLKIRIVEEDGYSTIGFFKALGHYILSVLPIIYIIFIVSAMISGNLTIYQAITKTTNTLLFGFIAILWVQIHAFTKRKTTAYDLICKTVFIKGRTSAKFPWSKI